LSYYYLLRHSKYIAASKEDALYHDAIRQVIQQGGDTETNACIFGGIIGALVGIMKMPK
jgi:ADP-ribosylglycohydrolase